MAVQPWLLRFRNGRLFPLLHLLLAYCVLLAETNITTDQSSLLSLKSHITSDPNRFLATNWSSTSPSNSVCDWIGVTCDSRQSRVVSLNISNMNLVGTVPANLGNLSFLVSLDLSKNNFAGNLPSQLTNLRQLEVLTLEENHFTGDIPSWFGSLRSLRIISLEKNSFTGFISPDLFNLSNLVELRLGYNSLEGSIPRQIGNLGRLKILTTGVGNQITGPLPMELFNISSLEYVWSYGNRMDGTVIPYRVCDNLPRLKALDLTGSKLSGPVLSILSNCSQLFWLALDESYFGDGGVIPQEIANMKSLEVFYLGYCNLTGEVPRALGNLTKLRDFSVPYNFLTGTIPREMFNISSLNYVNFLNNGLSGNLPNGICDSLSGLSTLTLSLNNLNGQLPSDLSKCSQLQDLCLDDNDFQGSIPRAFGNLTMAKSITLEYNHLTGTIPRELGNIRNLTILFLLSNNLRGPIPFDSLANCKRLTVLRVSYNPLNLLLPDSLGNLSTSFQTFWASNCEITGSIPNTIGNLSGLTDLDLSSNGLSGTIPSSMKSLHNLQKLNLRRNNISGTTMKEGLCGLLSLSEINMEYNEISGPVPECLGNILSLRKIWLGRNRLDGNVPISFGNLKDLIALNLSGNILTGSLPAEVGNLKAAILIDLSANKIFGNLPVSMGYLLKLQTLLLQKNEITGSIPSTFGEMVSLVSLDLSYNNISGKIPSSLEKLLYLKFFNVSFNHLSGEIPDMGPFLDFGGESFGSNNGLCGSSPRFNVPPCPNGKRKRNRVRFPVWIIILLVLAVLVFVLSMLIFVYLKRFRKKMKKNEMNELESSTLAEHERVSYYEILQATEGFNEDNILGKGSFGSVYKAALSDKRIVAVKVFNTVHDDDDFKRVSKSFQVECELLSQLRHRNLTKVISSCCINNHQNAGNFKALVLEYMINGSLEQWLYPSENDNYVCLNIMQRLNIMLDVASALDYLHSGTLTPVVHCDIKPSNILLDEDMVAHVTDFGIAKLLGHEDSITCTQTLATFGYLAPEYGSEGLVSTKSDVYSYGILLMEVFTRKKPNDEMFGGNINLRSLVSNGVLNSTLSPVVDADLLLSTGIDGTDFSTDDMLEFLKSIMEVAIHCTKDLPRERFTMSEVIVALEKIKVKM